MPISPTAFVTGVSALIRVEQLVSTEYRRHLREQPFSVLFPPGCDGHSYEALCAAAGTYIRANHAQLLQPGERFGGLYRDPTSARTVLNENADAILKDAIDFYLEAIGQPRSYDFNEKSVVVARSAVLSHREWLEEGGRPRWGRLGLGLADIALGIVAAQPEALGLNRRATEIIAAVGANLSALVANDTVSAASGVSVGERLVQHFVAASLETVAEHPEMFVSSERWKPIVQGVVVPLTEYVQNNEGKEFLARERLSEMLRGPLAHSLLTAINANADQVLTSKFGGDQVLGSVTRAVLGAVTSADPASFDLRDLFSGKGAVLVYEAALGVASARPELFVGGAGEATDAQRALLKNVADAIKQAPRPYEWKSGLAPQIAAITIEVAGEYASRKLRTGEDADPWEAAGADVARSLIGQIVGGFKSVVGDGPAANPFETVFDREQAVDILRIIATHVAASPEMVIGATPNPEIRNIAAGVAQAVAADSKGLLDGEGWRSVIATTVEIAARNPGALFGITGTAPTDQVAVVLMRSVLTQAAGNMTNGRRPGAILFGETLREVLTATITAAASNLLVKPPGVAADVAAPDVAGHAASLELFIAHLLQLAAGANPEFRMSADEWLHIYRTFVAHVLAHGPAAVPPAGSDWSGGGGLLITDQLILDALQGLVGGPTEGGEVG